MILSLELISGLVAGVEIFWEDESTPIRGFVVHFCIFRLMVLWFPKNEQPEEK